MVGLVSVKRLIYGEPLVLPLNILTRTPSESEASARTALTEVR